MAMVKAECFLVSVDFSKGEDVGVLIVGKKRPNESVEIVNAYQGEEALELYKRLIHNPNLKKSIRR